MSRARGRGAQSKAARPVAAVHDGTGGRAPDPGNARPPTPRRLRHRLWRRPAGLRDRHRQDRRHQGGQEVPAHPVRQGRYREDGPAARRGHPLPAQLLQEHLAAAGKLAILRRFARRAHLGGGPAPCLQEARERVGIAPSHSFHSLRHSAATHLLERGGNIEVIRDGLGHRSADTTRVYARATGKMFEALDHPLSGFPVLRS